VNGLDVLVLDDVYTSGGSVHSFAVVLRNAGAASVRAVVLARNLGAENAPWVLPLIRARHDAGCPWTAAANKSDVIGDVRADQIAAANQTAGAQSSR
jgi:orotate phosphoribosyltransferase